jgi:hypothetical protein
MERGKLPPEKRGKPTGPKAANFPMEWIARGGKKAPGVPGVPGATALTGKNGRNNDAADGSITTATSKKTQPQMTLTA